VVRGHGYQGRPAPDLLSVAGDCAAPGFTRCSGESRYVTCSTWLALTTPGPCRSAVPPGRCSRWPPTPTAGSHTTNLSCNGSFMVFNHQRDLLDIVGDFMQFFVDESCGICVPCRAGNVMLRQKVGRVAAGRAVRSDLDDMVVWGGIVAHTSRCGWVPPHPIRS